MVLANLASVNFNLAALSKPQFTPKDWSYLVSFRPPADVQNYFKATVPGGYFHKVEDGYGDINLDYYPVLVRKLPAISGSQASAEDFLKYIRLNLNDFIDADLANFFKYDDSNDALWKSDKPLKSIIRITMRMLTTKLDKVSDFGDVIVGEFTPQYWIFSTIYTPNDLAHPVSGNRQFGFTDNHDGTFTFYTRGADRATRLTDYTGSRWLVFPMANKLWKSLQAGIVKFVGQKNAELIEPLSNRVPWKEIKNSIYKPAESWL